MLAEQLVGLDLIKRMAVIDELEYTIRSSDLYVYWTYKGKRARMTRSRAQKELMEAKQAFCRDDFTDKRRLFHDSLQGWTFYEHQRQ
jgi:hypothetical protein